jgi:hypothetical protein
MPNTDELEKRVKELERQVASLRGVAGISFRGIRKRSAVALGALPLYDIALGPDPERGELRGHARGVVAVGDIATGIIAIGGLSRGVFAVGGLAAGLFSLGGLSVGVLLAVGGLAIGGLAIGGAAIGGIATGGGAAGYYACGGGAVGEYVVDARRHDVEAEEFFREIGLSAICGGRIGSGGMRSR